MIISSNTPATQIGSTGNKRNNQEEDRQEQVVTGPRSIDKSQEGQNQGLSNTTESPLSIQSENQKSSSNRSESELDQEEIQQVRKLSQRDREVRAHEQAHASVAGSLAKGGPSFSYQRGPDGQLYAIGGEVKIDASAVAGDPEATAEKAQQIQRAALAPAQPSQQDRAVASAAAALEAQARAEIAQQQAEDSNNELNGQFSSEENTESKESASGEEKIASETQSKCAQCGGQHSAESHAVSIALDATFKQTNPMEQAENLFKIAV